MTALASLVELEDPWLPPTTWDSIPSQNAPGSRSRSRSRSYDLPRPSPHNGSSVSEASLVRLALSAMQGSQSALLSIKNLSSSFCYHPADRSHRRPWNNRSTSTLALRNVLISIASFGSLVLLLRKFVHHFRHSNSLVNQAFAVAVGRVLEGYVCSVDTLYASVAVRRQSRPSSSDSCFTSVVHSQITLLELYLHTTEPRTRIEALGNICNLYSVASGFSDSPLQDLIATATSQFSNFYTGGDLLTYLYTQLQVADPAHRALLKFLFLRSCEPYCGFVRSWIFEAEISDPYKEFVVECVDNLPFHLLGKDRKPVNFPVASIRDGVAVPCFLGDFLIAIFRAGQQLQVLKKLLEVCNTVGSCDYMYKEFLPSSTGYIGDNKFCASPMTFGKRNLEAMGTARHNYYIKMQEKLKTLLTKLEFRYQQELPPVTASIILDNGRSSNTAVSPSLDDRAFDNTDPDYSSAKDEFYALNSDESTECSSSGAEEQTEVEKLIEHPDSLVGHEQRYLFSLRFSLSSHIDGPLQKPIQSETCHGIESDLREDSEKRDDLVQLVDFCHRKTTLTQMFLPPGLGESNCSGMSETQNSDTPSTKNWQLDLPKSPFYNCKGYSFCNRLDLCNSDVNVSRTNMKFLKAGLPYFGKTYSTKDVLVERTLGVAQLENEISNSNLFTHKPWKINHNFNFLSRNPMLRKHACFCQLSKPRKKCSMAYGQTLPCFDFSTVEDPCMVCAERFAASSCHDFASQVPLYVTASGDHDKGEQVHGGDDILIEKDRMSPLDFNEHGQEAVVSNKVCGGSSWESLLGGCNYIENERIGDNRESLCAMFEIPLDFIIDKCLLQEILLQYNYVSKLAIKLLEEGFHLKEHLLAVQRYYFMQSADWADLFIMSLWRHRWNVAEADQRISEIQRFLDLSVQRSSCEHDPNKGRLFVYRKGNGTMPVSAPAIGLHSFDSLCLGYRVDWPVNIILTPRALKTYALIFSFLMQVKLAGFSLTDAWCTLKTLMDSISRKHSSTKPEWELGHFRTLIRTRHQVNHFICALQQYVHSQLSHVSWCRFLHSLRYKVKDMMDLESVHMAYLTDSLHICFLSDETRAVASIIESILQCAFDFRSCLTGSIWDVGLDEGDLLGKLSRISMSQVLGIKQKFDKNLKQLHLCYIKSPKHGEFGLSRFWGYLNYNNYYSDIANEIGAYNI